MLWSGYTKEIRTVFFMILATGIPDENGPMPHLTLPKGPLYDL